MSMVCKANAEIFGDFLRPFQNVLRLDNACTYARKNVFSAKRIDGYFE